MLKTNNILKLACELNFPQEVQNILKREANEKLLNQCEPECRALTDVSTAFNAYKALEEKLKATDENGFAMLAVYLDAACIARETYSKIGIADNIFIDTMSCLTRFLNESNIKNGKYVFDRAFWAWRQLSGRIFRLGTLEFEYRLLLESDPLPPGIKVDEPVISVHIPSDAVFTKEALQSSYSQASDLYKNYNKQLCHSGAPKAFICGTWLLSPELKPLLKPSSGILCFANDYDIYFNNINGDSVYTWLFKGKTPPQPLPQDTSLQRSAAAHLKSGGKIGEAFGLKSFD